MYSSQLAVKTTASLATRRLRGQSYKRRQRVTLHILAEARCGQDKRVGWLLDLSDDGMFFRTAQPFEKKQAISIEFYLPQINEVVRCVAEVETKVSEGGLGPGGNRLRFKVLRPPVRLAINRFVSKTLKDRLDRLTPKQMEVSLLTEGLGNLPDIQELSKRPILALCVDNLPDVGAFLEALDEDMGWEPHNEVGHIDPEDMIPLSIPAC